MIIGNRRWLAPLVLLSMLLVVTVFVFGCGGSKSSPQGSDKAAQVPSEPVKGGVARIGLSSDPGTLDPHTTTSPASYAVRKNFLEGLLTWDENVNVKPSLADSWEVSPDGKTYTFKLRKGVKFHNGKDFTAAAVKWNFDRILKVSPRKGDYSMISNIETVDQNTVKFNLKQPSVSFLSSIGLTGFCEIIEPEDSEQQIAKYGSVLKPVGTGVFQLVSYTPGSEAKLKRYEGYIPRSEPFKGLSGKRVAYLDELVFLPKTDASARLMAFESGDIDYLNDVPPQSFSRVKNMPNTVLVEMPGSDWGALYFNCSKKPFDNVKGRQAIAAALNYKEIADATFWGHGVVNNSPICMVQKDWRSPVHDKIHQFSQERAKQLLKEAGYNGEEIVFLNTKGDRNDKTAIAIQSQLEKIGVKVKIETMELGAYLEAVYARRYKKMPQWDLVALTKSAFRPDPDQHYYERMHSSTNAGYYSNPAADKIVTEARNVADFSKRKQLYEQAQQLLMEDVPFIKLYDNPFMEAYKSHLKGLDQLNDPQGPYFFNVWIDKGGKGK